QKPLPLLYRKALPFLRAVGEAGLAPHRGGVSNATTPVVMAGTYVISSTPTAMMTRNGSAFRYRSGSGFWNRDALRNRFRPMGGKRNPSSRFARKTTPRWTGSTPKAAPSGATSGASTTIAE